MTRMGSSANNPCDNSSPSANPNRVTIPTMVMYRRVSGRMALYFVSVSDTADLGASSFTEPFTFAFPVAVFSVFFLLDVLYRPAVLPPFFLREAPPRSSKIVFKLTFLILDDSTCCDDVNGIKFIRRGWNEDDFAPTPTQDKAAAPKPIDNCSLIIDSIEFLWMCQTLNLNLAALSYDTEPLPLGC